MMINLLLEEKEMEILVLFHIKIKKIVHNIDNVFQCFCIYIIKKQNIFLIGGKSENIKIYNINDYKGIGIIEGIHNNFIRGIINLNDDSIASFSDDKSIKVYNLILPK